MTGLLADGPGSAVDQGVATLLFIAAAAFGLVAVLRLRGRAFRRLPVAGAWVSALIAVAAITLAVVLPPVLRPEAVQRRPSTSARIAFERPAPAEVFRGDPASVPVRVRLTGGRLVSFTSRKLVPNAGHLHLYLDGALVSMTLSAEQLLPVRPGPHILEADFVAVDHAPFVPAVRTTVSFRVVPR